MSQYEELNLLLRKLYQYERDIMGKNTKTGEIDVIKAEINRSLRKIREDISQRNNMRMNKEKGKTRQLLQLSAEIKREIEEVERLINDFRLMIETKQMTNKEYAMKILENFETLLAKLQESENENVLLTTNMQPDKYSGIDFSSLISHVERRGLASRSGRG